MSRRAISPRTLAARRAMQDEHGYDVPPDEDPVLRALDAAPIDDEPETDEEREAVDEARREPPIPHAEVKRRLIAGDGYPVGWPRCPGCGAPALDGHITCGDIACDERGRR